MGQDDDQGGVSANISVRDLDRVASIADPVPGLDLRLDVSGGVGRAARTVLCVPHWSRHKRTVLLRTSGRLQLCRAPVPWPVKLTGRASPVPFPGQALRSGVCAEAEARVS